MTAQFKESFKQDLMHISEDEMLDEVRALIERVEKSSNRTEIPNLKKLTYGERDYKIKMDEYRVGVTIHHDVVMFVRCLHHNDISDYFLRHS